MKTLLTILFFTATTVLFGNELQNIKPKAQKTVLSGTIGEYANAELKLIYRFLGRSYIKDSCVTNSTGDFRFNNQYENGIYEIYLTKLKILIPVIINDENEISLIATIDNGEANVMIIESKENTILTDYGDFINSKKEKYAQLTEFYKDKSSESDKAEFDKISQEFFTSLQEYADKIIKDNSTLFVSAFLKAQQEPKVIECDKNTNKKKCQSIQYYHYRDHFFDNIDFSDERLVRTQAFGTKITSFFDKVLLQQPDTIIEQIDLLLQREEMHPEFLKTILVYTLNKYAKTKIIGFDAIYVHLADEYYAKNKTPWLDDDQKNKIIKNADEIRPLLIGEKLPNLSFTDVQTGVKFDLYETKYNKAILYIVDNLRDEEFSALQKYTANSKPEVKTIVIYNKSWDKSKLADRDLRILPNVDIVKISEFEMKQLSPIDGTKLTGTFFIDENFKILFKRFSMDQVDEFISKF